MNDNNTTPIKRTVLDADDIMHLVPALKGKYRLVNILLRWLKMEKVNKLHSDNCDTPGAPFVAGVLRDLNISKRIDNEEILDEMVKKGAFITVSNHPFGALDGVTLIDTVASRNPRYKVMVNLILNYISAMRPNFIAVDPFATNDPEKRATTMKGIREAMNLVREGVPVGFFPAGAVSKITTNLRIEDRKWQPSIIRIIKQLKVPVVPIYFHGHNSLIFNILGLISWKIRTLRLPSEVFLKRGKTIHISVGEPIMPEEIAKFDDIDELGEFLKQKTYSMREWK